MKFSTLLIAIVICLGIDNAAFAVIETYEFSKPELEARYQDLSQELRCPKCQNQNIADSDAPISRDLRSLLHDQLEAGATDEEILAFMTVRYGDFVRYRPEVNEDTAVLWFAPGILLIAGAFILITYLRRRGTGADNVESLSEEERALLAKKLGSGD